MSDECETLAQNGSKMHGESGVKHAAKNQGLTGPSFQSAQGAQVPLLLVSHSPALDAKSATLFANHYRSNFASRGMQYDLLSYHRLRRMLR